MSDNLTLKLNLKLDEVVKGIQSLNSHINNLVKRAGEPIKLKLDDADLVDNIKSSAENIKKIAGDTAQDLKNKSEKAANNFIQDIAHIGLAFGPLKAILGSIKQSLTNFVIESNKQAKETANLISALRMQGEATEQNIKSYHEFSNAMQRATHVADEQVLSLITLATNMGIAENSRRNVVQGAIGLSKAFESAGLSQQTALKGITQALEGNFSMLQRYIPALQSASSDTEKMTILKEAMANGFQMAKDEINTSAGALQRFRNEIGNFREMIGDVINKYLVPLLNIVSDFIELVNNNPVLSFIAKAFIVLKTAAMGATAVLIAKTVVTKAYETASRILTNTIIKKNTAMRFLKLELYKLKVSMKGATGITVALTKAKHGLIAACKAVGIAIKNIPVVGWILAVVAGLISLVTWIRRTRNAAKELNDVELDLTFRRSLREMTQELEERVNATQSFIDKETTARAEHNATITRLNEEYQRQEKDHQAKVLEAQKQLEDARTALMRRNSASNREAHRYAQVVLNNAIADQRREMADAQRVLNRGLEANERLLNQTLSEVATERLQNTRETHLKTIELNQLKLNLEIITREQMIAVIQAYYDFEKAQYDESIGYTQEYLNAKRMLRDANAQRQDSDLDRLRNRLRTQKQIMEDNHNSELALLEDRKTKRLILQAEYETLKTVLTERHEKERNDLAERSRRETVSKERDHYSRLRRMQELGIIQIDELRQAHQRHIEKLKELQKELSITSDEFKDLAIAIAEAQRQMTELEKSLEVAAEATESFADKLRSQLKSIQDVGVQSVMSLVDGFSNAFADMLFEGENFAKSMEKMIKAMVKQVIAELIKIAVFKAILGGATGGVGAMIPIPLASGGYVSGAGTGTSDSIPAMLSNGEYVINAGKTSVFRPLLDLINYSPLDTIRKAFSNISLPSFPVPALPKYAYASGGFVSGGGFDVRGIENRLDRLFYSLESGFNTLERKDYQVVVQPKWDGVKFIQEYDKARAEVDRRKK